MPPNLHRGQKNLAVRALQSGLHNALAKKGRQARNNKRGTYGSNTVRDVTDFETLYGVRPISGKSFGPRGWRKMRRHLGKGGVYYLRRYNILQAAKNAQRPAAIRRRIVEEAMWGVHNSGRLHYRQARPMASSLRSADAAYRTDCSSYVTLCFKAAGAPDPNGFGYNGYGYTGTLVNRGEWTRDPQPGDLAFYGNQGGGVPSHVALHIGNGKVATFGSEPGPIVRDTLYRSDYRGSKTYAMR